MDGGTLLMGGAFIAFGVGFGAYLVWRAVKAVQSTRWPVAAGQLVTAGSQRVVVETGLRDGAVGVTVKSRYTYTVDGKTYTGKRVTMSDSINKTRGSVDKLVAQYEHQQTITVRYNPANPAESVLVPGLSIYNFTPMITAALFIAAGLFVLQYDWN